MSDDNEWYVTAPSSPGEYEFKCLETGFVVEKVPVEDRRGTLWAKMDGLWNQLSTWHDNLTDCWWRRL